MAQGPDESTRTSVAFTHGLVFMRRDGGHTSLPVVILHCLKADKLPARTCLSYATLCRQSAEIIGGNFFL